MICIANLSSPVNYKDWDYTPTTFGAIKQKKQTIMWIKIRSIHMHSQQG